MEDDVQLRIADDIYLKDGDVRLESYPRGQVNIYKGSKWYYLNAQEWSTDDKGAGIICNQLNYASGGSKYLSEGVKYSQLKNSYGDYNFKCSGVEKTILDC